MSPLLRGVRRLPNAFSLGEQSASVKRLLAWNAQGLMAVKTATNKCFGVGCIKLTRLLRPFTDGLCFFFGAQQPAWGRVFATAFHLVSPKFSRQLQQCFATARKIQGRSGCGSWRSHLKPVRGGPPAASTQTRASPPAAARRTAACWHRGSPDTN